MLHRFTLPRAAQGKDCARWDISYATPLLDSDESSSIPGAGSSTFFSDLEDYNKDLVHSPFLHGAGNTDITATAPGTQDWRRPCRGLFYALVCPSATTLGSVTIWISKTIFTVFLLLLHRRDGAGEYILREKGEFHILMSLLSHILVA